MDKTGTLTSGEMVLDRTLALKDVYKRQVIDMRRGAVHQGCPLLREAHGVQAVRIGRAVETVSYTHLDVYKRQDVDGAHIRILLLTFFYRYMRPLIEKGYVYILSLIHICSLSATR